MTHTAEVLLSSALRCSHALHDHEALYWQNTTFDSRLRCSISPCGGELGSWRVAPVTAGLSLTPAIIRIITDILQTTALPTGSLLEYTQHVLLLAE